MRFGVLGALMVWDDRGEPVAVPEAKVRALLADLLTHPGHTVSAGRLIDDLWGAELPGNPANALQAKVSQLRRAIGRERVAHQRPGYRLVLDGPGDEVDADLFAALAGAARQAAEPAKRVELLGRALELWRGPEPYADFAGEQFAHGPARRLTEQRLAVLEDLAEARLELGEGPRLLGELADLVATHPLRERLRSAQMRALYLAGRQAEALASYAELRRRLSEDLGLDPGPGLASLHEAILRQDASLGQTEPALPTTRPDVPSATPPEAHHPLPAQLTPLIGREQSLNEVGALLAGSRLVTLTGPGGVGKTRLALAAAGRIAGHVPDGVRLVELAGLRGEPTALVQQISAVLGIRDDTPAGTSGAGPRPTPLRRLTAALRDRTLLLVLDNAEQIVEELAELTDELLRAAPGLRVLTTSQEPLGLLGEAVHLVEPLGTADAVRLFAERAAAAAPGFSLDEADDATRHAAAEICRRLDGIPLALELAAIRVRSLGVRELAVRLQDRFRVLGTGRRGAPARQQTLRAMIDWSWELLTAPERIVLRRLAVHRESCALDAAEAVSAGEGVAREDVLDLITRLVDRSLVVMADGPNGPRYRLLESVAAYATERLHEMADLDAVRTRHLHYYLGLAEQADRQLRGSGQRSWLARLNADAGNLRAALDEALRQADAGGSTPGAAEPAIRLAAALSWWWWLSGRLGEGRHALGAVLDAAGTATPGTAELRLLHDAFAALTGELTDIGDRASEQIDDPVRRGRALWLYAYGCYVAGHFEASEELLRRAHELFDGAGDRWGSAAGSALCAVHALHRGDLAALADTGPRAAEMFRELGDNWGELQTVSPLAVLAEIRGDYPEAARRHREGLRIAEEFGLSAEVSQRLSGLGRLALLDRDWEQADELHGRALRLAAERGHGFAEVFAEIGLALGARRSGRLDAAERHLLRVRDWYQGMSAEAANHLVLAELGFAAEQRGERDEAARRHLLALRTARSIGDPRTLALSLEGLAGVAALTPATAPTAARLLGAADAARRGTGFPLPPAERYDVDRITVSATAALGPASFAQTFGEGAGLTPDQAAALAPAELGLLPVEG